MTAELKPYPTMKDSGVEWLGMIPEHWELRRLRTLLRERVEKGYPNEPLLAATQTKGVVRKEKYENRTVLALKDLHLLKLVREGDFVISLRSFQGGIEYARERGIISPAYTILFTEDANHHRFLSHLFKSKPYIENLGLFVTGIRQGQNIDYEKLSRSSVPLPPIPEQVAIARYLDYVDVRVRRLTEAKRKLIGLLTEYKQAIIHHAVTRGLDPNVPLKDSGIEWLGMVPQHWEVRKLREILHNVAERNRPDLPLLSVVREKGVIVRDISNYEENHNFIPDDLTNYKIVRKGQFAMNKMKAWQGSYGVSKHDGIVSPAYYVFNLQGVSGDFFNVAIRSKGYVPFFTQASDGVRVGQWDLSQTRMREIKFLIPPLPEQVAIVEYLDRATAEIDIAVARAERQIELLNEYRTRLVADVVTGKLDVRDTILTTEDTDTSTSLASTDSEHRSDLNRGA